MGREARASWVQSPSSGRAWRGRGLDGVDPKGSSSSWLGSDLQPGSVARERRAAGESKWGAAGTTSQLEAAPRWVGGRFEGCLEGQG